MLLRMGLKFVSTTAHPPPPSSLFLSLPLSSPLFPSLPLSSPLFSYSLGLSDEESLSLLSPLSPSIMEWCGRFLHRMPIVGKGEIEFKRSTSVHNVTCLFICTFYFIRSLCSDNTCNSLPPSLPPSLPASPSPYLSLSLPLSPSLSLSLSLCVQECV